MLRHSHPPAPRITGTTVFQLTSTIEQGALEVLKTMYMYEVSCFFEASHKRVEMARSGVMFRNGNSRCIY